MSLLPSLDDCAPRWSALMLWSLALGWGGAGALRWVPEWSDRAWPDALFSLAFATALRCPGREYAVFAWCGAMRDVWLGWRWGANVLLYLGAAVLIRAWKRRGGIPELPGTWWWAGMFALPAALPRGVAEAYSLAPWREGVSRGALVAVWTGALFPLMDWLFAAPGWRPWRRRHG